MKRSESCITSRARGGFDGDVLSEIGHALTNSFMSKSGREYVELPPEARDDDLDDDDRRWRWGDCKLTFSSLPLAPRRRFVEEAPPLSCSADDSDGDGDDGDGG